MKEYKMEKHLNGDAQKAIGFLKQFHPNCAWTLTVIAVDTGGIKTKTFSHSEEKDALRWIEGFNGKRNLYFQVNPSLEVVNKKAKKEDIKALHYLHVDIDPESGEDLEQERERILDLLTVRLPRDVPKPSSIVFSGGGYQAFWKLKKPVELKGDTSLVKKLEMYNKALEELLGGDKCHDISRIMRLPGTVNIPDEGKRKKGRTRELSKKVYFKDLEYSLEDFPQPQPENESQSKTQSPVDLSNLKAKPISDLGELDEWNVSDRLKVIIHNGNHHEMPKDGDNSRSVWLFDVCCGLVRCAVPDEVILGIITDGKWAISESVLDKGALTHKYAVRQIESAKEKVGQIKRKIIVQEGDLTKILNEAELALIEQGSGIFQRGKNLVRTIRVNQSNRNDGIKRDGTSSIIEDVDSKWLTEEMGRTAQWVRNKKKGDAYVEQSIDPNEKYAKHLLVRTGEWGFDVLNGVVTSPTLRKDGTVLQIEGYDIETGLKYESLGVNFPSVPEHPTKEDAKIALEKLEKVFAEFPFVDDSSKSVALSAVLTGLVRRSIETAPLFAIDAPTPGTGKSLLCDLVSYIVTGHSPSMITQGKNPEEDEKRLASILKAGDSVIVMDNCEQPIGGDFLCAMLTSGTVKARILGKSEVADLHSNVLVMATGNNIVPGRDMGRRMMVCRLDAQNERPDNREFKVDIRKYVKENRPELVVAGLTILRAYIVAGYPNALKKIGSFETWNWVREAMVWLGCDDPEKTREQFLISDPRTQVWGEILELWHDCYGNKPTLLRNVKEHDHFNAPSNYKELCDALMDFADVRDFNTRSIGSKMKGMVGRIVNGKKLCKVADPRIAQWYVVQVHEPKNE